MQRKKNIILSFTGLESVFGQISILAVFLVISLTAVQSTAQSASMSFEATFTGDFGVTGDVGKSVLFVVEESGSGNEATFGAFDYTASLLQNLARVPQGCGPNSSTGADGFAIITFSDGQLRLKRISGTACFEFPIIHLEEQWRIASGTEAYAGATGKLSREFDGNVISVTATGTISGTIRFP